MGEFDTFAIGGKDDCMIPDDIAAAECVHADFPGFPGADVAEAAVGDVVF